MEIKIPKLRIIRPQNYTIASEEVVRQYLKVAFWLSPLMWWKLYEILKELMT